MHSIDGPGKTFNPEAFKDFDLDLNKSEVEGLRRQLQELRQKRSYYTALGRFVPATGLLFFVAFFAIYIKWQSPYLLAAGAFYLIVAIAFPMFSYAGAIDTEIEAIESEIALRLTGAEATEQRAERLFKAHGIDLRRYYQQTLRHSAFVFATGISCVVLGFGIVGYTLYDLKHVEGLSEKVLTGAFGLVSGVLTNFVAAIYLKMFAETITTLTGFHRKLVTTNHLHFANFLLAKVSDPAKRDENYARLAALIASASTAEKDNV
ncbi:hypothetical protein [Bradyrhizobium manausense]|uniref:hypothetical protein n=1 Tax=Bradyrhizobium manausense TaxID=989370 RepID=UPI001BA99A9B|nr:hypothetical protein [Bradyrhizobium manausense]MBR0724809.1 hypothetical protein [Bradyrhizobium manausense]